MPLAYLLSTSYIAGVNVQFIFEAPAAFKKETKRVKNQMIPKAKETIPVKRRHRTPRKMIASSTKVAEKSRDDLFWLAAGLFTFSKTEHRRPCSSDQRAKIKASDSR
jgi:hypothetical protein